MLDIVANSPTAVDPVVHAIQQSVAPAFLLTGIGALLSVLTNRLARVVDRFRALNTKQNEKSLGFRSEMLTLGRRARFIHWAISCCTVAALLICIVIAALFIGSTADAATSDAIAVLFISAMFGVISGLLCFLAEISLATGVIDVPTED
ncbi:MAG: DUF2721 domain-containing protein [Halioglobus sp.]|nr:DUF2721 domain-containing protein [Halioglobus sp.]